MHDTCTVHTPRNAMGNSRGEGRVSKAGEFNENDNDKLKFLEGWKDMDISGAPNVKKYENSFVYR